MDDMRELIELQREGNAKKPTKNAVTAFIGESGCKKREVPQLIDAQGPDATSKNAAASTSVNSISNKLDSVNNENSEVLF